MEEKKYGGMTVNERLLVSELLSQFDQMVAAKDVDKIIYILKQVELDEASIEPILKRLDLDNDGSISN